MEENTIDINLFHQGERNVFKTVYNSLYNSLCLFTNHFVNNLTASEDIVQETFLTLWKHREEMESYLHIKSFLYSATRNAALDYLKHLKIRNRYEQNISRLESTEIFEHFIIEEEVERILLKTQENLPAKCKQIFILAIQGKDNEEIATILNISVNTVKTQKKIAYKKLKQYISGIVSILVLLQKYY